MNSDGWKFKRWLDKDEAAQELSEKTGTKLSSADALRCALDRGVPFVVYVPSGTPDCQGRHIMERGLWELMTEGARGEPGRQQVEHEINQNVPVVGIDGAWVERDRVQRQLRPPSPSDFVLEALDFHYSAIPDACTLGLRREDVEDLAETLNKELAEEKPTPSAPKAERVQADWKDLTITFLSDNRVQMKIGDRMLSSCTCEELQDAGFWDRHAQRPTKAWDALRLLAEGNGTRSTSFEDRRHVEIRMSEMRKKLRAYLTSEGIEISDSDPLPYDKHTRTYTATFTIGVGTNFK
jgi:hypothetical protein